MEKIEHTVTIGDVLIVRDSYGDHMKIEVTDVTKTTVKINSLDGGFWKRYTHKGFENEYAILEVIKRGLNK